MTAGDFGEGVEGKVEIFGKEIAAEVVVEAVEDTKQMFVGTSQGIVMTSIGDDDVILSYGGDVGCLIDGRLQVVQVRVELGADGQEVRGEG